MKLKKSMSFIVCFVLLMYTALPAFAATPGGITPYYNNTITTDSYFVISSTGKATIGLGFIGIKGTTQGATVTSYIEKKVLGLFWVKVDIGTSNNTWVDTVSGYMFDKTHSVQLSERGTYRARAEYVIRGSGGNSDVIPYSAQKTY